MAGASLLGGREGRWLGTVRLRAARESAWRTAGRCQCPGPGLPLARWGPGNEGWPGDRGPYTRLTFLLGLQRGLWHLLKPG